MQGQKTVNLKDKKEIITMTNENEKKIPTVEEPAALKLSDEEMEKINGGSIVTVTLNCYKCYKRCLFYYDSETGKRICSNCGNIVEGR